MAERHDGLELGLSLNLSLGSNSRRRERQESDAAGRKKQRLSTHQTAFLEETFNKDNYVNKELKTALAEQLNMTARQVAVWFQNRRVRAKGEEKDRRLQKEVAELKALKCPRCDGKRESSPPPPPPTFHQFNI